MCSNKHNITDNPLKTSSGDKHIHRTTSNTIGRNQRTATVQLKTAEKQPANTHFMWPKPSPPTSHTSAPASRHTAGRHSHVTLSFRGCAAIDTARAWTATHQQQQTSPLAHAGSKLNMSLTRPWVWDSLCCRTVLSCPVCSVTGLLTACRGSRLGPCRHHNTGQRE